MSHQIKQTLGALEIDIRQAVFLQLSLLFQQMDVTKAPLPPHINRLAGLLFPSRTATADASQGISAHILSADTFSANAGSNTALAASPVFTLALSDIIDTLTHTPLAEHALFLRLMKLDAALCQLDLGLYGLCADCETDIEVERLSQDPTEQRCFACAQHYEHEHRHELRLSY